MKRLFVLMLAIYVFGYSQIVISSQDFSYDYLAQTPPSDTPIVFAQGTVSVDNKNSHALVVSPDGKLIIFSRYPDGTSYILSKENDTWTGPVESFFYGKEVSFSPDGNKIFYYTGGDIFYVEKKSTVWSQPIKLGLNVNTASLTEYYPSIVKTGDLYFSRDGNWATGRLMNSKFQNGEFQRATDLGLPINNGGALHAWFSPDESYVLFNSPRTGSHTQLDIWISFKQDDGSWSNPQNLGTRINSGADAILCPTVSPDGNYMFFTKLNFNPTTGYIYWVSTSIIDSLKNAHNTGIGKYDSLQFQKNIDLNQNYPNPFNPTTTIKYTIPSVGTRQLVPLGRDVVTVQLKIYDTLGQEIKTLVDSFQSTGEYSIVWDGTDDINNLVSSGIYFYRLESGNMNLLKKMLLIR